MISLLLKATMKKNTILFSILILLGLSSCTNKVQQNLGERSLTNLMADYNVVPNDNKDDSDGIIRAINSGVKHLYFPSGTYIISKSIELPNAIKLEGAPNAIFKASARMSAIVYMDKPSHVTQNFQIDNIIFDGNNQAQNCLSFYKLCFPTPAILRDVKCMNALNTGAVFSACQIAKIDGLDCSKNKGNGVEFLGCNAMSIFGLSVYQNGKSGAIIQGLNDKGTSYSGGMSIYNLHAESNGNNGIELSNVTSVAAFFGGWIEANSKNGVFIENSHVNLDGVRISGKLDVGSKIYPIYIEKNSGMGKSNVIVENCMIVNDKGSMDDVYDANNDSTRTIVKNKRKYNFIKQ